MAYLKGTTKENKLFDYVKVPSYLKTDKKEYDKIQHKKIAYDNIDLSIRVLKKNSLKIQAKIHHLFTYSAGRCL